MKEDRAIPTEPQPVVVEAGETAAKLEDVRATPHPDRVLVLIDASSTWDVQAVAKILQKHVAAARLR